MPGNVVQIQIRNIYGEEKAYPHNVAARHFADIAGTKTLTRATLRGVLALGCTLQEVDRHGNVSRTFEPNALHTLPAVR